MAGITAINWQPIPSDYWKGLECTYHYALWPSPVDHDQWFMNAGFTEFADSDDQWEADYHQINARLVAALKSKGPATVRDSTRSFLQRWFSADTADEALVYELIKGSQYDQLVCRIDFGNPPQAIIRPNSQVWWLSMATPENQWVEKLAATLAAGRKVNRGSLDWSKYGYSR